MSKISLSFNGVVKERFLELFNNIMEFYNDYNKNKNYSTEENIWKKLFKKEYYDHFNVEIQKDIINFCNDKNSNMIIFGNKFNSHYINHSQFCKFYPEYRNFYLINCILDKNYSEELINKFFKILPFIFDNINDIIIKDCENKCNPINIVYKYDKPIQKIIKVV